MEIVPSVLFPSPPHEQQRFGASSAPPPIGQSMQFTTSSTDNLPPLPQFQSPDPLRNRVLPNSVQNTGLGIRHIGPRPAGRTIRHAQGGIGALPYQTGYPVSTPAVAVPAMGGLGTTGPAPAVPPAAGPPPPAYYIAQQRPLMLPSLKKTKDEINENRNIDAEFDMPGLSIQGQKPSEEEREQYRNHLIQSLTDQRQFLTRVANNIQVPEEDSYRLLGTVNRLNFRNFIDNDTYHRQVLSLVEKEVNSNPVLNKAYREEVTEMKDPFLIEDLTNYIRTRIDRHGVSRDQSVFRPYRSMTQEFQNAQAHRRDLQPPGDPRIIQNWGTNEASYRAEQLEKILIMFMNSGQELLLKGILHKPELLALSGYNPNVEHALSKIVAKEQIRSLDPSEVLQDIIENKRDAELPNNINKEHFKRAVRIWKDKLDRDRVAAEANYMYTDDYRKHIENFWDNWGQYIEPSGEEKALMAADPTHAFNMANAANVLERMIDLARGRNRRKIVADINLFVDQLRNVQNFIMIRPDLKVSKILRNMVNTVTQELNENKIDVDEAYSKMNAIIHKKRAVLGNYANDYKPEELTLEQYRELRERDRRYAETHAVEDTGLESTKQPMIPYNDYLEKLRLQNNLFAFNEIRLVSPRTGAAIRRVEENVSDPTRRDKKRIQTNLLALKARIASAAQTLTNPSQRTPERYYDLMDRIRQGFQNQPGLDLIGFNDEVFPFMTQKNEPYTQNRDAWRNGQAGPQQYEALKHEYHQLMQTMNRLEKYLAVSANRKTEPIGSLRRVMHQTKRGIQDPNIVRQKRPARLEFEIPAQPVELHRGDTTLKEKYGHPGEAERPETKQAREKQYTFDNIKYSMKAKKEYPEISKTEIGDNAIEYNIRTEDDLLRMKAEVTRMMASGGSLFIIDLKTGRLFPIDLDKTFIKQTYVFIKNVEKENTAHARNPAEDAIHRDKEKLLPYLATRHDKWPYHVHRAAARDFSHDYRHQIRAARGAGLWGHIRKGISVMAKGVDNYAVKKTNKAVHQFIGSTISEGKNFVKQEKRNFGDIYNAGSNFVRDPSLKSFASNYYTASNALGKIVAQPVFSSARELSNVSDLASGIPGLNVAKYAAEFAFPPLAVADALAKTVKYTGAGSDDKARYFDAALSAGDALLGSGSLKGTFDVGARVIQAGAKVADMVLDKENH